MLISTPGLVLRTTPYSDTSIIVRIFTRQLGVRSYIVKGARGAKGKSKMHLLRPLSYLDMVVYNNPKKSINYIKEMRPFNPLPSLAEEATKVSVVFFMDELLYKVLKEEEPQPQLFDYITDSLLALDAVTPVNPSFPIRFLLDTARHIGIAPMDDYGPGHRIFDLAGGRFEVGEAPLSADLSLLLHQYLSQPRVVAPLSQRLDLIDALVRYFQLHIADFSHFHSHTIFHAILQ